MSPRLASILLLPLAACSAPPRDAATTPASPAPRSVEAPAARPPSPNLPPEACSREGYEAFVEAFVRSPASRPSLSLPGAPVGKLDIAMRDYSWVLASNPDTLLDIDEHRSGDELAVSAKPVERNEDDEVVKVVGPTRTYTFRYSGGCWKFADVK